MSFRGLGNRQDLTLGKTYLLNTNDQYLDDEGDTRTNPFNWFNDVEIVDFQEYLKQVEQI